MAPKLERVHIAKRRLCETFNFVMPINTLRPLWNAPESVHACCTTRRGGVSRPPYDNFNLADHVGDSPEHVQTNRTILSHSLGLAPIYMSQVHGSSVQQLSAKSPCGIEADAALTCERRVVCTVLVADCLPVLLADARGRWVAAVHAGWRGLVGVGGSGVLDAVLQQILVEDKMGQACRATEIIAWLGPCIGPTAFQVGAEVRDAYVQRDVSMEAYFVPQAQGRWLADLPGLARTQLQAWGLRHIFGNDGSLPWCTVRNPELFYSYRRDGRCGRMAACIWLD